MRRLIKIWPLAFILAGGMSIEAEGRDFGGGLSVGSDYTDNARKSAVQPQISERQDRLQLDVFANHENEYGKLDSLYTGAYNSFSESSQIDRNTLAGSGRLLLGKTYQPLNLLLSHTRRLLLNAPNEVALLSNTDEQTVTSVNPTARFRVTPVDSLVASADHSVVDYRFAQRQNSVRDTVSLQWEHSISKTDSLQVLAQQTNVTYEAFNNAQYTYRLGSATYATRLNRLDYSLNLGYNTTQSDLSGDNASPSYSVGANYRLDSGTMALKLNRVITDTSMGSNTGGVSIPLGTASVSQGFDQIDQRSALLSWSAAAICGRCTLELSGSLSESNYLTLPVITNEQTLRAAFGYTLSRTSSIRLDGQAQSVRYTIGASEQGYSGYTYNIAYNEQFRHNISASLTARFEQRSSEQALYDYDAMQVGFSLRYQY